MISVSLDPSVNNVGWSRFNSFAKEKKKAWRWGTFQLTGGSFEMKLIDLLQQMEEEGMGVGKVDFLVTERPAFFSSERGQIAARLNYTIDLAGVCYFVAGWHRMDHRHHFAITANVWKGSVPKEVTARRFFFRFPEFTASKIDEHGIDATMMHRFWLDTYARFMNPIYWRCKRLDLLIGDSNAESLS